jgi:tetratricopeptide (TPR) repeat protein
MKLPSYVIADDLQTFNQRLNALITAGRPAACPVHLGLGEPTEYTNGLGFVTHTIATRLAAGTAGSLPPFNGLQRPALRLYTAASWGRADAVLAGFADMPTDLTSDLWHQVSAVISDRGSLTRVERGAAAELMLRLDYPLVAAKLVDVVDVDLATHAFHPETVRAEISVLARIRSRDRAQVEDLALRAAGDAELPPAERIRLANFVVVMNGRRGTDSAALHQAADLGRKALEEMPGDGLVRHLSEHTLYRATAYEPYLRGDLTLTMEYMDQAERALIESALPSGEAELLSWKDHIFPLYETASKIHLAYGEIDSALETTRKLVEIAPRDHKALSVRAWALTAADDLAGAMRTWEQFIPLGGPPVATGAFYLGWAHEQLGDTAQAREYYALSYMVDPTPAAITEKIAEII